MNNENQNIEYKESWRDEYVKWLCGFAVGSSVGSDVTSSVTSLSPVKLTERQQVILGIIHRFVVEGVVEGWRRDSFSTFYC